MVKLFSTPALDAVRYGSASKMTTNEKLRRQAAAKNYQTMPKLFSTPALDKLKSATGAKTSSSAGSVKKQTNYYTPTKVVAVLVRVQVYLFTLLRLLVSFRQLV